MKQLVLSYSFFIISVLLTKKFAFAYTFQFSILILPLLFLGEKQLGLKKLKAIIAGILSSIIYFPFINFSNLYLYTLPQAFAEEVFFRAFLQNKIAEKINIHLSIIITSLLFAIPHIILRPDIFSALTFFPSILFGYLYYYTKSVWSSFIFHYFSNLFLWSNQELIFDIIKVCIF
ncbi:CPBP family intramembrane glutamic endopeptidase [Persephonella sp. IF05-L8]|uniref:CPBP family glutamic-type intramembrane protease n=1 Tax=Persephonella sp. IF05-L8 TaxID=1158338 RepID=UPI0009DCC556